MNAAQGGGGGRPNAVSISNNDVILRSEEGVKKGKKNCGHP